MARYVVHMRGEGPEALGSALFLREHFAWFALTFGPLWFLAKGAWIVALLTAAGMALLATVVAFSGLPPAFGLAIQMLIGVFLALEANALRSWELRLKGYRDVAIVAGDDREEVERRFFAEAMANPVSPASSLPGPFPQKTGFVPVIGLFPSRTGGAG
jgi:vacuolar-type H+-ATPase subunit I/STV1